MSVLRQLLLDGQMARACQAGDVIARNEIFPATSVSNALLITAAILAQTIVQRTPTANATDTIDSAANILQGNIGGLGNVGIQDGTTWHTTWYNNAAFTITLTATANTGVTVNAGVVNASSVKDFLITVNSGTPAAVVNATTVNGSAVISGLTNAQCASLGVGQVITNAVAGCQGFTILGINQSAGTVTLSANATSTNTTPVAFNFSPRITIQGMGQGLL